MKCEHPDFWFDRCVCECSPDCDERMHNVCVKCGATECQIIQPMKDQLIKLIEAGYAKDRKAFSTGGQDETM